MITFKKTVSKGSRFNQVYIPKEFEKSIEPGDLVEVRLISKQIQLIYSNDKIILSEFKKRLIKDIFDYLTNLGVSQIFVCGSFIYKTFGYNDIDLVLVSEEQKEILDKLTNEFSQKFHLVFFQENDMLNYYKKDPIIRTMLSLCVTNKQFDFSKQIEIDANLIKDRLMFSEDLLKVKLPTISYIDNLKRLIAIEKFLNCEDLDITKINKLVEDIIKPSQCEYPSKQELSLLRKIIRDKLTNINMKLKL